VIVLPYRPPLMFARQVAALQELSGGRLLLGVGIGLDGRGVSRAGASTATIEGAIRMPVLAFSKCFAADVVEANGQPFLFGRVPQTSGAGGRPRASCIGARRPLRRRLVADGNEPVRRRRREAAVSAAH
jgi:hypothetical protein